jgi:hypothetical protein
MKRYIKVIALLLSISVIFAFAGCGLTKTVTVKCTCPGCLAAEKAQEKKDNGSKISYSKLKANGKSGVDCSKLSSSSSAQEVFTVYQKVANATKAAKNQSVKVTAEGAKIAVKEIMLDKSGKPLGTTMMSIINKLITQFAPAAQELSYKFVNGTDTNGNKDDKGKVKTLIDVLPVSGDKDMCKLTASDITDAKAEKLNDGYYKLTINIKDASFTFKDAANTPETPHSKCMATMKSSDLIKKFGDSAEISSADLQYKDSVIEAIIDPASGYLVQLYTGLNIYGSAVGNVSTAGIGGLHATLDRTTYNTTYNWSEIG